MFRAVAEYRWFTYDTLTADNWYAVSTTVQKKLMTVSQAGAELQEGQITTLNSDVGEFHKLYEAMCWGFHIFYMAAASSLYFTNEFGALMTMAAAGIIALTFLALKFVKGEVTIWKKIREKNDE